MNYNIENTLLTEEELGKVTKIADDKLVDILAALVDSSSNTFYGEYRLNNFTKSIIDVNDKISSTDTLLRSLESKTEDELKELAKEYKVDGYEKLTKSLLLYEVEKAIYIERNELRDASISMANTYTSNYQNTFEYFISTNIAGLDRAINTEHNLDLLNKYKFLRDNFVALDYKLKTLHGWLDIITPEIEAMNEDKDEIDIITKRLKENQNKFAIGADADGNLFSFEELKKIKDEIDNDSSRLHELRESISVHKANTINLFNSSNIQINFANLKMEILENLVNIQSNIKEAYDNKVLTINADDIQKVMKAFNEYFNDPVYKQFEFTNFLRENDLIIDSDRTNDLNNIYVRELKQDTKVESISKAEEKPFEQEELAKEEAEVKTGDDQEINEEKEPVENIIEKINQEKMDYAMSLRDPELAEKEGREPVLTPDCLDETYDTYKEKDPVVMNLRAEGNDLTQKLRELAAKELTSYEELENFKKDCYVLSYELTDIFKRINARLADIKEAEASKGDSQDIKLNINDSSEDYEKMYEEFIKNCINPEYRESHNLSPLHKELVDGTSIEDFVGDYKRYGVMKILANSAHRSKDKLKKLFMSFPTTKEEYEKLTHEFDLALIELDACYQSIEDTKKEIDEEEANKEAEEEISSPIKDSDDNVERIPIPAPAAPIPHFHGDMKNEDQEDLSLGKGNILTGMFTPTAEVEPTETISDETPVITSEDVIPPVIDDLDEDGIPYFDDDEYDDEEYDEEGLEEDQENKHSFASRLLASCFLKGDKAIFKIKEAKENTSAKITENKDRVKHWLIGAKWRVWSWGVERKKAKRKKRIEKHDEKFAKAQVRREKAEERQAAIKHAFSKEGIKEKYDSIKEKAQSIVDDEGGRTRP